ncbi:MAG: hypothetical protein HY561_01735 [Gemmatimonadetes bacterium]|nr:hypothetical protein [Gemmatimonadota bacterium]
MGTAIDRATLRQRLREQLDRARPRIERANAAPAARTRWIVARKLYPRPATLPVERQAA